MKIGIFRLLGVGAIIVVAAGVGIGYEAGYAPVSPNRVALPKTLIDLDSPAGRQRLQTSNHSDYEIILPHFSAQELRNTCGIASAASVLNSVAGAPPLSQTALLSSEVEGIKPGWRIRFGGMQLDELAALIKKEGKSVEIRHAGGTQTVERFRTEVLDVLNNDRKFMVVNFSRRALGQDGVAHLSPIGAYDAESDSILIMDVAAHKYPMTWIPTSDLFDAMNTVSTDSPETRGWLVIE